MRGDRAGKMTTDLALAFTAEAVSLRRADGGGWLTLGSATVGAPDFATQVAALRTAAAEISATTPKVALVLPVEHVLSGDLPANGGDDAEDALRKALEARSAPDPALLLWAIAPRAGQTPRRYCAALRETVEEAARYARGWGFEPTGAYAPDAAGGAAPPAIAVPGRDEAAAPAEKARPRPAAPPPPLAQPAEAMVATPEAGASTGTGAVDVRRRPESRRPPTTRRRRGAFAIWAALGAAALALAALAWLVVPDPPAPSADLHEPAAATTAAPDPEPTGAPTSPVEIAEDPAPASDSGAAVDVAPQADASAASEDGPATSPGLPPRPEPPVIEPAPDAETAGDVGAAHMPQAPDAQVEDATNQSAPPRDAAPTARAAVEIADQPSAVIATLTPSFETPPETAPTRQAPPAASPPPIDSASPRPETAPDTPPPDGAAATDASPPAAGSDEQADAAPPAEPVAPAESPEAAPAEAVPPPPTTILPPLRPQSFVVEAVNRQAALVEAGPRPAPRPRNLAAAAAPAPAAGPARAAPSNAPRSIRTAATINDGLSEGLALIGVFGSSDGRRALVRGEDGAVRRVRRGDRIDGWSVAAIEADAIRLTAGGRSQTLRVPGR